MIVRHKMARKNSINRGKGIEYNGKVYSKRGLQKKFAREERAYRKQQAFHNIPSYGVERPSKKISNNIMYLYSNGLINV